MFKKPWFLAVGRMVAVLLVDFGLGFAATCLLLWLVLDWGKPAEGFVIYFHPKWVVLWSLVAFAIGGAFLRYTNKLVHASSS